LSPKNHIFGNLKRILEQEVTLKSLLLLWRVK